MKPVLRYPGSKWGSAPWIIEHFPPHEAYVEPFFGSGAVLLRKRPSRAELVNDLEGSVVAFFRVLRDRPGELAAAISLTPYARDELAVCADVDGATDELELARRLAVACWQTRGGPMDRRHPAWRFDMNGATNKSLAGTWAQLPDRIRATAQRFVGVAIENLPALEVIAKCALRRGPRGTSPGGEGTLIYADPPYLSEAADPRLYRHGMSEADHLALLDALDRHRGPVLVSGYHSALYADRLAAWSSVERRSRNILNAPRLEVLWLNRVAARQVSLQLPMREVAS